MTEKQDLDSAITAMDRIAEAVKKFDDAELRAQAFGILSSTVFANGPAPVSRQTPPPPRDSGDAVEREAPAEKVKPAKKATSRKAGAKKANFEVPKDINFAPDGEKSFKDFAAEKSPTSNNEKALVAAYYLTDYLKEQVTIGKVIAAFRAVEWRSPANPDNNLHQTGSRGWLDTKDMSKIEVVWSGRNFVEHDLPKKKP
ncbi:hypothetical protein [Gordonia sp. i37]|uniref:hypothetical protein n=1 Tax=Gordonia sp. i37 TaxID=1961707 RepID=UPI00111A62CA|nr:hypothetical protein [Gordonia sp. i37]